VPKYPKNLVSFGGVFQGFTSFGVGNLMRKNLYRSLGKLNTEKLLAGH